MTKDVESVLSIALSLTLFEDCLIWALTSSGKFTVKSVYRLALDERAGHGAEESSNSSVHEGVLEVYLAFESP